MRGIPTPGAFAISWVSIEPGLKTVAPKTAMGEHCGRWSWFEEGLAYDNARLPQALMLTGMATKTPGYVDAGLKSLRWLMTQQTAPTGHFRPIGTDGFGELRQPPRAFDQQPVEATATIAACL